MSNQYQPVEIVKNTNNVYLLHNGASSLESRIRSLISIMMFDIEHIEQHSMQELAILQSTATHDYSELKQVLAKKTKFKQQ